MGRGLQDQICSLKERVKTAWIMSVFAEQVVKGVVELEDIVGNAVGKITVLGLAPNILDGIEFRGVTGQPRYVAPGAAGLLQLADSGAVSRQAIADHE